MQNGDTRQLSPQENELWRGFLTWSEGVTAGIARALNEHAGLSVAEFEILARMADAPDQHLGQQALGDSLGWSASRLSHQLTRMEKRELIVRESAGIGRYMTVRLTPRGEQATRHALQIHAGAVHSSFLNRLTTGQQDMLRELFTIRSEATAPASES